MSPRSGRQDQPRAGGDASAKPGHSGSRSSRGTLARYSRRASPNARSPGRRLATREHAAFARVQSKREGPACWKSARRVRVAGGEAPAGGREAQHPARGARAMPEAATRATIGLDPRLRPRGRRTTGAAICTGSRRIHARVFGFGADGEEHRVESPIDRGRRRSVRARSRERGGKPRPRAGRVLGGAQNTRPSSPSRQVARLKSGGRKRASACTLPPSSRTVRANARLADAMARSKSRPARNPRGDASRPEATALGRCTARARGTPGARAWSSLSKSSSQPDGTWSARVTTRTSARARARGVSRRSPRGNSAHRLSPEESRGRPHGRVASTSTRSRSRAKRGAGIRREHDCVESEREQAWATADIAASAWGTREFGGDMRLVVGSPCRAQYPRQAGPRAARVGHLAREEVTIGVARATAGCCRR